MIFLNIKLLVFSVGILNLFRNYLHRRVKDSLI